MSAENNLIKAEQLKKIREVDFVTQFTHKSLAKLIEVLGVTRRIPMMEGTTMYTYKMSGTLQSGAVAEGEIIPLSQYAQEKVPVGEITLNKWRKAVSAEAIKKSGYATAVTETDAALLRDVQNGIRTGLFGFINAGGTGATTASGNTLQALLANLWGQLQVLFEDDTAEAVYFVNPLDVADYLGTANITVQTAFGMNYVENFLGLGRVFFNSQVPKGKIYSTAMENLIAYYIPVNGADLDEAFAFTADETGFIGIHEFPDYTNMTASDTVVSGIKLMAERIDGVVVATIAGE